MTKEERLLIDICACALDGGELSFPDSIDTGRFTRLALNHNLTGVCYVVFNENRERVPQELLKDFYNRFIDLVYVYEKQSRALGDIDSAMVRSSTEYLLFKGAVLRALYPVSESRSMGDIDMLVKPECKRQAVASLEEAGFECYASDGSVTSLRRDEVVVELHTRLLEDRQLPSPFDNAVFDGFRGVPDDSFHLAYMIAHTANHLKYTGAGIRLVLDIAFVLKNGNVDINKVFDILEDISLAKFGRVILSVCHKWFGYGVSYVRDTDRVQQYLVEDGVFGSMKDSVSYTVARLRQVGAQSKQESALKLKLRLAFPPYSSLKKAGYINFLDGRPWLLPAAWCYRVAYNIKHTPSKMNNTLKNLDDEKTLALAREELEFFEEIGI